MNDMEWCLDLLDSRYRLDFMGFAGMLAYHELPDGSFHQLTQYESIIPSLKFKLINNPVTAPEKEKSTPELGPKRTRICPRSTWSQSIISAGAWNFALPRHRLAVAAYSRDFAFQLPSSHVNLCI